MKNNFPINYIKLTGKREILKGRFRRYGRNDGLIMCFYAIVFVSTKKFASVTSVYKIRVNLVHSYKFKLRLSIPYGN